MLGVAIIGLGMAVEPHARSLVDLQGRVAVRWAASRSTERTGDFARRFPFPTTNDVAAAIADPDVDAVLLLTPPDTHLELGRRAIASGKHLLVEKPLDARLDNAHALVAETDAAGVVLTVALQHRFRPSAERLRELLDAGDLGEIQFASASVPWWRPQSYYDEPGRGAFARDGGGVLMTQAIHTLDLLRSLLGPLEVVAAVARTTTLHRMEAEDYVSALLKLRSGAPVTLMATTAQFPGAPEQIQVTGTQGSATLTGGALRVRHLDGREEQLSDEDAGGSGADFMAFSHQAHRSLIEDFITAIETGRPPRVTGHDALATQSLIDDLLRHAGGAVRRDITERHLEEIR